MQEKYNHPDGICRKDHTCLRLKQFTRSIWWNFSPKFILVERRVYPIQSLLRFVTEESNDSDPEGFGICALILTAVCLVLVVLTFPFSLVFSVKVSSSFRKSQWKYFKHRKTVHCILIHTLHQHLMINSKVTISFETSPLIWILMIGRPEISIADQIKLLTKVFTR